MFCTKCGHQIKDGFKFCPKCGAPVYVEKDVDEVKTTSSNNSEAPSSTNKDYIPNPLIAEELDIEGVKKKAEQGDKEALLRQAFRYEMGIGVEKDVEKAKELYDRCGGNIGDSTSWTSDYFFSNILSLNLCVKQNNKKSL